MHLTLCQFSLSLSHTRTHAHTHLLFYQPIPNRDTFPNIKGAHIYFDYLDVLLIAAIHCNFWKSLDILFEMLWQKAKMWMVLTCIQSLLDFQGFLGVAGTQKLYGVDMVSHSFMGNKIFQIDDPCALANSYYFYLCSLLLLVRHILFVRA